MPLLPLRRGARLMRLVSLVMAVSITACSSKTTEAPSGQAPAQAQPASSAQATGAAVASGRPGRQEAAKLYNSFCATCHGPTGQGDGGAAQGLSVRPRDYSDRAWQASITDQALAKVIVEGGGAVGKSVLMPASPALKDKPEVVAELVTLIRSFAAQP